MDSALVARQSDRLLLIDKETLETQTLTDSVFDQTKLFPGLLDCAGDTVYYTCLAPESNTLAAYALNLATYEKNQIYYGSAVTNDAGFLGLDEVLGFVIQTSDLLNAAGKSYWLNQSGLHTAQDRTAELMTLDETDGYGVYEGMYKMAETDTSVFFINNFGELIRYDWEPGTFTLLSMTGSREPLPYCRKDRSATFSLRATGSTIPLGRTRRCFTSPIGTVRTRRKSARFRPYASNLPMGVFSYSLPMG